MPETVRYRRPSEVARRLKVSSSTLRRWSAQFAFHLSDLAGEPERPEGGGHCHRRYSDEDIATLALVKQLLDEGQDYGQVDARLKILKAQANSPGGTTDLVPTGTGTSQLQAAALVSDAIHTVVEGQQLLLNSQQVTRDLLNVALQDNFNLKEENARLRERMMRLEQELSENRRREEAKREMLERRLERLEEIAYQLTMRPPERRR